MNQVRLIQPRLGQTIRLDQYKLSWARFGCQVRLGRIGLLVPLNQRKITEFEKRLEKDFEHVENSESEHKEQNDAAQLLNMPTQCDEEVVQEWPSFDDTDAPNHA